MSDAVIRIAILDMYDGEPNQGMRCIIDIINRFNHLVSFTIFDVRRKAELPDIKKYDVYISTGGPGNPLDGDGNWDLRYYEFVDALVEWNTRNVVKKHVLFICHSFQMACKHFGLAEVTRRTQTSFGVMRVHKTPEGMNDPLFDGLDDPFYAVDSRDYQVVLPKLSMFAKKALRLFPLKKYATMLITNVRSWPCVSLNILWVRSFILRQILLVISPTLKIKNVATRLFS